MERKSKLLIGETSLFAQDCARALQNSGCLVTLCEKNGNSIISALSGAYYDAVVAEFFMPGADGADDSEPHRLRRADYGQFLDAGGRRPGADAALGRAAGHARTAHPDADGQGPHPGPARGALPARCGAARRLGRAARRFRRLPAPGGRCGDAGCERPPYSAPVAGRRLRQRG